MLAQSPVCSVVKYHIIMDYISEHVKPSGVVLGVYSHPLFPYSKGALLGGDLNNSNGGCPSPVRESSTTLLLRLFRS